MLWASRWIITIDQIQKLDRPFEVGLLELLQIFCKLLQSQCINKARKMQIKCSYTHMYTATHMQAFVKAWQKA